ncbi:hypothetical protein PGT21_019603 [Puccinia graminis f. sp. tritici]|uniref:separase n=1 Tax=Puccinia graminis f. sp. tritici TaxID=56615 RepID=A0A5B0NR36_PUCGR|nr:hypothetical protein PGT21_019603 [Puccinia graminis f. sp. tritici]KAA1125550.1 hypothetical protein PGTUg99_018373 [Puccinia graminis f. sp. tritici]
MKTQQHVTVTVHQLSTIGSEISQTFPPWESQARHGFLFHQQRRQEQRTSEYLLEQKPSSSNPESPSARLVPGACSMSRPSPPATPRRSTRARPGPSKPPSKQPSTNLPNYPSDIAIKNGPLPLPKLKFTRTGSTKTKNVSTNNELSSKPSVSSKSSELRLRPKTTRSAGTEPQQSESNHVDKITRGIQQISIAPNLPKKTLRSKTSTLVCESKQALPLGEQINLAMKTVNISLSKLSAIRQTGWKAEPIFVDPSNHNSKIASKETIHSVSDSQLEEALEGINQGYLATQTLRKLISNSTFSSKSYDVERAGLALVNHAIELKLYNSALRLLEVAHCSLQALISHPTQAPPPTASPKSINPSPIAPTSWQSYSKVLSFLIPKNHDQGATPNLNSAALLVLTAVAQGFQAFLNGNIGTIASVSRGSVRQASSSVGAESVQTAQIRADCCLCALESSNALVEWIVSLDDHSSSPPDELIIKKILGAVQACYSATVKACSSWEDLLEPRLLFQLRKSSVLLLLASQVRLKELKPTDTSMDQARRTLLLYARSCPQQMSEVVSEARNFFTQIVQIVQSKETPDWDYVTRNAGWRSLCEVMIGLARKIGDVELVNQTSTFLYSTSETTHDQSRVTPDGQPSKEDITSDKHVGLLLLKITATSAALDLYLKTTEDQAIANQLDNSILTIAALAHQRTTMSTDQYQKMNILIDRLRRICARALRKATVDGGLHPTSNVYAACASVSRAIVDLWVKDIERPADTTHEPVLDPAILSMMITGTTETLITLAESLFQVNNPDSHHKALQDLSRCARLIELLPEPDVSVIRCLTSTYYNTGVALYQVNKLAMAINFVRPSCELPSRFFPILQLDAAPPTWSQYDDANGELEVLKRQLLKRWELLAICYLQIDRSQAYQAYVSAVASHSEADFRTLGKIADDGSDLQGALDVLPGLCKLVQRVTWLATCDMLLPISKCNLLESLAPKKLSNSEVGAILELQLQYLYQNTRKSECRLALKAILDECSQIYQSATHPFRRARTLIRLMEWHVSMSTESKSNSTFQVLNQLLGDVSGLLDTSNSGLDDCFKPYVQQFSALAYMWLAVAAQSRNLLNEFLDASEASISGFEKVPLPSSPVKPEPTLKKEAVHKSKARGTVKPNQAPPRTRSGIAKPNQNSNPLATPPNKRVVDRIDSMKTPEQQGNLKSSKLLFQSSKNKLISADGSMNPLHLDDRERLVQHLMLFTHILGAHGLVSQKLRLLRFLQDSGSTHTPAKNSKHYESQISIMVELASTYLHCEEYTNASTLLSDAERFTKSLPPHTLPGVLASESLISLLYSRCFSEADDPESADCAFISAGEKWAFAMEEEDDHNRNSDISSAQKVIRRTKFLRMIALASFTYSHIKEKQGDLALAIEYATRTVRLLHRASSNILRISNPPQPTASKLTQDVFSSNSKADDCAPLPEIATEVNPHSFTVDSHPVGEITWQVAAMIPAALSRVIALYINRGSPRLAEAYLNQFSTVSDQIGSHRLKVLGIVIKANILTLKRQFDDAHDALKNASAMIEDRRTFELAEIYKLKCEISYKLKSFNEAKANCAELGRVLQELDSNSTSVPRPTSPLNSSRMSSQSSRGLLLSSTAPAQSLLVAAQTNRIQVLVARAMRRPEQVSQPLRLLAKMPYKIREQVFETTLLAMLGLDDVLQNFRVDPLLGVLSEAMIVIPSTQSHPDQCKNFQDQFPQLSRSLTAMEEALTKRTIGCADIPNLHETIHVLITLKFINSILQRERKNVAGEVAALLDFVCSLTIRREMVECIRAKSRVVGPGDDTSWPSEVEVKESLLAGDEMRIASISGADLSRWQDVASHHRHDIRSPATYRPLQGLPTGWHVVSIHLAFEEDSLFIIQHNKTCNPLGVKLPLDRFNRREGEDELFTLKVALEELQAIVSKSNAATQRARHVTGRQDKISWWQERKDLDTRMRNLVERIENDWLGACKGLLRPSNKVNEMATLQAALENLFRHHLICSQDKTVYNRPLDQHIISCFVSLPINCRDEDLEDLIQFVVDSYQIHEAPVVGDEVDVDQVVCELRNLQKEFLVAYSEEESSPQHLFLILDKHLHGFPWEVLPILMGHSVSRIPSLSFLRDRLGDDQQRADLAPLSVDPTRTSYILNPSGDLTSTQLKFESWLESRPSWSGIKARPPSSEEVKQALLSADLMLYFGHGGAEQYVRSQSIKQLPRCAVTMLWGCSSGMLHDQGDFDPTGTPYAYMLAGCPALLANLWDVTDKDIDKLALDLFVKTGLQSDQQGPDESSSPMTLTGALASARSSCQLKYLNGAAPIIYGIPVTFQVRKPEPYLDLSQSP